MIIEQSDISNFEHDNTLYSCGKRLPEIKENLVSDKSHHKHELKTNSIKVEASDVLSLGICRKARYKLHALRRIRKFLTIEKATMLGNTFIDSQFNYAPLLWMFCRETLFQK